ncbi:RNA polymerase-associated protein [Solimonas aquatica]|uniref:RNA polymerase-associated protein n=1 Tax=Solimonas aquatica TaxID=489703 RepID=A0A1H9CV12_9GAMM|nr:glutathione S-transferase N-terminal domain-containing protein [Solimonas aquatica]SEQ05056.1 RNA polymerase-associated protein [Solimonas aquatica]
MALPGKSRYVMEGKPAPRAGLTLFCARDELPSLWARIVLAEKEVDGARVQLLGAQQTHPDLLLLNPTGQLPTLADRDTVLYPARVVVEYLDERYPHPKLMPVDPAARARLRMLLGHIEQELFSAVAQIRSAPKSPEAKQARKALQDALLASRRLFGARGWCMGLDFNLADCAFAAIFASLSALGVKPPADAGLLAYAQRVLARAAVQSALS